MIFRVFLFCCSFTSLFAIYVGNPSAPSLYPEGIFTKINNNWNFRLGYLYDRIYKGSYEEKIKNNDSDTSTIKLKTEAALLTLGIKNRIDLYGILGNSKLQLQFNDFDEIVYAPRNFSWGSGIHILLWKKNEFGLGSDFKYFYTNQKPTFFLIEKELAPLASKLELQYKELQASISFSYQIQPFIPYLGITYLYSSIDPNTIFGLFKIPEYEFEIQPEETKKKWGFVLGSSIISNSSLTLNIETRMFDQKAWNISGEIRF